MAAKLASIPLLCLGLSAQTPAPRFEVASIKPATPLGPMGMRADRKGGPGTSDPVMYTCRNCPIAWVLSEAYDLLPFEFAGPDRLQDARFDFLAKVPAGTTKAAFRVMLQNLLADRFKLTVHREKKEMPVYELTVAKNGPNFREAVPADAPKSEGTPGPLQRDKDGFPILPAGWTMAVAGGHARLRSDNQPISWFARQLAAQLHGPVIDATGLKEKYDFLLSWSFDEGDGPGAPVAALINAVQSQLGLKLQQKKGKAEVLVVDHIEKEPSEN